MHGLKNAMWAIFQILANWLDWPMPCYCSPPKSPTGSFVFLFYMLIFIYFFKYETIVRSSTWSFGHSDPDRSSVIATGYPVLPNPKYKSSQGATPSYMRFIRVTSVETLRLPKLRGNKH